MSISSETRKAGPYTGNGVTTAFPFSFKVFSAADVQVVRTDLSSTEAILTLTADYTVALNPDQDASPGGTVTMVAAPLFGYLLTLTSQLGNLQPVVLTNAGGFYPKVINDALDRVTILVQQLAEKMGRAITVGISSEVSPSGLLAALFSSASAAAASAAAASAAAASATAAKVSAEAAAAAALANAPVTAASDPAFLDASIKPASTNWVRGAMRAISGTATNDSAAAGIIGEYVESAFSGSSQLANAVSNNCVSMTLSAGDWDVNGIVEIGGTSATITRFAASISAVSATLEAIPIAQQYSGTYTTGASGTWSICPLAKRISISAPTTVYLVANCYFGSGTLAITGGLIRARRVR